MHSQFRGHSLQIALFQGVPMVLHNVVLRKLPPWSAHDAGLGQRAGHLAASRRVRDSISSCPVRNTRMSPCPAVQCTCVHRAYQTAAACTVEEPPQNIRWLNNAPAVAGTA